MPTKIIKQNANVFTESLFFEIRKSLAVSKFSSLHTNIAPVHKKGSCLDKNNYRAAGILPNLSKKFEINL